MLRTGKKDHCQTKLRTQVNWSLVKEHHYCENKLQRGTGIQRSRGICQSWHSEL